MISSQNSILHYVFSHRTVAKNCTFLYSLTEVLKLWKGYLYEKHRYYLF